MFFCVKGKIITQHSNQFAADFNMASSSIQKNFKKAKYPPYKLRLVHDLSENAFDEIKFVPKCKSYAIMAII